MTSPFVGSAIGAFCDDPATTFAVVPSRRASAEAPPQFTIMQSGHNPNSDLVGFSFDTTAAGAAVPGTDFNYTLAVDGVSTTYTGNNGTVYVDFPAGVLTATVTIEPLYELGNPGKKPIVILLEVSGTTYVVPPPNQMATLTISNGDAPGGSGPPSVSIGAAEAVEGDNETFTVTLSHAMPYVISVPYYTSDRSAIESTDYLYTAGTVEFPANSTTPQTITVPTLLDQANTAGLTFYVILTLGETDIVTSEDMGLIEPIAASLMAREPDNSLAPNSGAGDVLFIVGDQKDSGTVRPILSTSSSTDGTFTLSCTPEGVVSVPAGAITPGDAIPIDAIAKGTATVSLLYTAGDQTISLTTANFTVDTLQLIEGDNDITNRTDLGTIRIGQKLDLFVAGAPSNATIKWTKNVDPFVPTRFVGSFRAYDNDGGPQPAVIGKGCSRFIRRNYAAFA